MLWLSEDPRPVHHDTSALSEIDLSSSKSHFCHTKMKFQPDRFLDDPSTLSLISKGPSILQELQRSRCYLLQQSIEEINDMSDDLVWIEERERFQQSQELAGHLTATTAQQNTESDSSGSPKEPGTMSLLTAASFVVKSARFSPHRRPTYIPIETDTSFPFPPPSLNSSPYFLSPVVAPRTSPASPHSSDSVSTESPRKSRPLTPYPKIGGDGEKIKMSQRIFFPETMEETSDEPRTHLGKKLRRKSLASLSKPRRSSLIPNTIADFLHTIKTRKKSHSSKETLEPPKNLHNNLRRDEEEPHTAVESPNKDKDLPVVEDKNLVEKSPRKKSFVFTPVKNQISVESAQSDPSTDHSNKATGLGSIFNLRSLFFRRGTISNIKPESEESGKITRNTIHRL